MNDKNITVCISYDQKLVAEGVAGILTRHKGIAVAKLVVNKVEEISTGINESNPDLLIFESEFIVPNTLELIKNIRRLFPKIKLLIVSGLVSNDMLNELMQFINGYILRTCDAGKLILSVHEILKSENYLCPQLISKLFKKNECQSQIKQVLSPREKEVFLLWFQLEDVTVIAAKLHISNSTVRSHLKNIRDKLGNPGAVKMIFYACQESQLNGDINPVCPFCKSYCTTMHLQESNSVSDSVSR